MSVKRAVYSIGLYVFVVVFPWITLSTYLWRTRSPSPWLLVLIWLPAACSIYWIVVAVRATKLPGRRGLFVGSLAFIGVVSSWLGGFAQTYYSIFGHHDGFDATLSRMNAAYFTLGTFSSAGSGFSAVSTGAQAVVVSQMVVTVGLVAVVLALILGNVANR